MDDKVKIEDPPEGKDRKNVAFHLEKSSIDPSMMRAASGTIYKRDASGSIRRLHKPTKEERKAVKRARKLANKQGEE